MMKDNKEKKNVVIVGLLIAIIVMAVGYAALAQTLTINGTARVSSSWDIHFGSGKLTETGNEDPTHTGDSTVEASEPSINADGKSTTAEFNVTFKTPGDYAEYDFVVNNDGTLNGKLTGAEVVATAADGTTASTLTEPLGINYEVSIDDVDWQAAKVNQPTLTAGDTSKVHVKVYWDKAATKVPEMNIKKLKVILTYTQA